MGITMKTFANKYKSKNVLNFSTAHYRAFLVYNRIRAGIPRFC
ncbi:hypothetical protein BGLY_0743 [Bacillus glycinifermentans]|nr:hypothetical protein BGLY_0743 [Bacillus glycinifermentans]